MLFQRLYIVVSGLACLLVLSVWCCGMLVRMGFEYCALDCVICFLFLVR